MNCPKCQSATHEMTSEGVELDFCPAALQGQVLDLLEEYVFDRVWGCIDHLFHLLCGMSIRSICVNDIETILV